MIVVDVAVAAAAVAVVCCVCCRGQYIVHCNDDGRDHDGQDVDAFFLACTFVCLYTFRTDMYSSGSTACAVIVPSERPGEWGGQASAQE